MKRYKIIENDIEYDIEDDGITIYYRLNGNLHRESGPVLEDLAGNCGWFRNNLLHREDGPATILADGTKNWFYDGVRLSCKTQEEFEQYMRLKAFW